LGPRRPRLRRARRRRREPPAPLGALGARRRGGARDRLAPPARGRARAVRRMSQIPALVRVFAYLSLLTVGGGLAAFPELETLTVNVHHWLTFPQLVHLYSLGQMAPGPNMMMIVAIGQWAGGLPGAAVVGVAFFLPTAVLAVAIGRLWVRLAGWPW